MTVFAQDNAFGQGNVAAVEAILGGKGATVNSVLVAEDATEFTPFAQQVLAGSPDLVFVAWAGATSGAMWQAMSQQGVLDEIPVVTGLGDSATFGAYGEASEKINFLNHYFPGAPDNDVNTAMVEAIEEAGGTPDLFSPDGFNAAIMIVQAIKEGQGDVDAMVVGARRLRVRGAEGRDDGPRERPRPHPGDVPGEARRSGRHVRARARRHRLGGRRRAGRSRLAPAVPSTGG